MIPQGHQAGERRHEEKDVDVIGVVLIAALVLLIVAISYLTVQGLLRFVRKGRPATDVASYAVGEKSKFPQPRLEVHPAADLADSEKVSERQLHSYGWVDRKGGLVHIPIERAMQLLLDHGLPEVGSGQTRLQLMQARPTTDVQPANPVGSPSARGGTFAMTRLPRCFFRHILIVTLFLGSVVGTEGEIAPVELNRIGYDQHIGQVVSRDLVFRDSENSVTSIGQLRNTKPTLLVLGYYHCPMLCTLINDGLIESLQELRFDVGRDFNVINVSIDPNETASVAAAKKREYLKRYGRPGAAAGWHFLTGDKQTIAQLANETGFRFAYDPATHEYAHPSGFIVLTPEGRISRYFFGVNYEPKELRSAIIAASNGKSGSVITQLILLCYHYNPITGKYGALVLNVLRVLSVATVLLLAAGIVWLCRREPQKDAVGGAG